MTKPHCRNPWHLAALLVVAWMAGCCLTASASDCVVCRRQVVVQHALPIVQTPAYYQVGAQIQQESVDTAAFRHSPEYADYLRLQGYVQRVQEERGELPPPAEEADATPPAPLPEPAADEPTPATTADFVKRYPTIAAKCARCHSGDEPKGGLWLDGSVPLDGPEAAVKRDAIVRETFLGTMPKNGPLEDAEFGRLLAELYPPNP